jgi:hypothetical protein
VISTHELYFIKKEYDKPKEDRDYDALDDVCKKLIFFKEYSRPTRLSLLKLAEIVDFEAQ